MIDTLDEAHLRSWIGREQVVEDVLDSRLAERFHATLSRSGAAPALGEVAPRLIHFCLCQPAAAMSELGQDGHPARGEFLPPVALPRRMWAGSDIRFVHDLQVGDVVTRASRIADVVVKHGRTGPLCFVTVDHHLHVGGQTRIEDRQTIVYRGEQNAPATHNQTMAPAGEVAETVDPCPTLLFRYSALTFNGHRIHYDAPYARDVEGYAGLVVHGPLQATLLLALAERIRRRPPAAFRFRSISSLFDNEGMILNAQALDDGSLELWTRRSHGPIAMQARAEWC